MCFSLIKKHEWVKIHLCFLPSPCIITLKGDSVYQYICLKCQVEFKCEQKKRKFCSQKCACDDRNDKVRKKEKKICSTCKIEKDRERFSIKSSVRGTLHFECKECQSKRAKNRPLEWKLKEKIRSRNKARKKRGIPLDIPTLRSKNETSYINKLGYRILSLRLNEGDTRKKEIREHSWIMSQYLGRPLYKHENIHHKNGIRDDNRIENLELWSKSQPPGQRVEDKLKWCVEFAAQYGYKLIKE